MARIRSIKPEFWTSEQVVECSTTARLLFIGLWNFCDDNGVHPLNPRRIKMEVFPGDDESSETIRRMLDELSSNDLIQTYQVDNVEYLQVTGWKKHQRIDRPNYKYPTNPRTFDESSTSAHPRSGVEGSGKDRSGYNPLSQSEPVDNFQPSDETLEFCRMHRLPKPEQHHIAKFIAHHKQKRTHFRDDREQQNAFQKWMAGEKQQQTGDGNAKRETPAQLHARLNAPAFD